MKQIIFIAIVSYAGLVSEIENDSARVIVPREEGPLISDISTGLLPCEVSVGDTVYIRKNDEVTEIRCTEFPDEESENSSASVDIRINPVTGEIEYVIRNIEIELE